MGMHQIIYTSCMRGIDGVNDGQQIFSYDKDFGDTKSDAIKSLFAYQTPALEPGQMMTEELATTMPRSFMFRNLQDGRCAITLNTYLGRDYMGSAGRFGNHLSHSIVCNLEEFSIYPCEVYGSSCLRDHMEFAEVNNPEPPAYLPAPSIEKGYVADVDAVTVFLGDGERLEYLKSMLDAVVNYSEGKKRIVICDTPDNIILWIAAIDYCLPLFMAKSVNFTTYEFDPELSRSEICGVVANGTRYNPSNYISSDRFVVFDFINNIFSVDSAPQQAFMDFVDTALSFSYDSLTEYFEFLEDHTKYRNLDQDYYNAYLLYNFLFEGFSNLSESDFSNIINFADKYADQETRRKLVNGLISGSGEIDTLTNSFAIAVLRYLLKNQDILSVEEQRTIRQLIVHRVFYSLSDNTIPEDEFGRIYESVDAMARGQGMSVPAELMNDSNRTELLGIISGQRVAGWKIQAIIRIICDYVRDMRLPVDDLQPGSDIGRLIQGVFTAVYNASPADGEKLIAQMLHSFQNEVTYLTNIALNVEGYLLDIPGGKQSIDFLWREYSQIAGRFNLTDASQANSIFAECDRYDQIYGIYSARLAQAISFEEAQKITYDLVNREFDLYPVLVQTYGGRIMEEYFSHFEKVTSSMQDADAIRYGNQIMNTVTHYGLDGDFVDPLMGTLLILMQPEKLKSDDICFINDLVSYQTNVRKRPVSGHLLLYKTGIEFQKIHSQRDIGTTAIQILNLSENRKVPLRENSEFSSTYWDWLLSPCFQFTLEHDEYRTIFQLFDMSSEAESQFVKACCEYSFSKSKKRSDESWKDFAEFISFLAACGNKDDEEIVGKYLCKLGKQKLQELDESMAHALFRDRQGAHCWDAIEEIAENTNPLMEGLSNLKNGLFKRKN